MQFLGCPECSSFANVNQPCFNSAAHLFMVTNDEFHVDQHDRMSNNNLAFNAAEIFPDRVQSICYCSTRMILTRSANFCISRWVKTARFYWDYIETFEQYFLQVPLKYGFHLENPKTYKSIISHFWLNPLNGPTEINTNRYAKYKPCLICHYICYFTCLHPISLLYRAKCENNCKCIYLLHQFLVKSLRPRYCWNIHPLFCPFYYVI